MKQTASLFTGVRYLGVSTIINPLDEGSFSHKGFPRVTGRAFPFPKAVVIRAMYCVRCNEKIKHLFYAYKALVSYNVTTTSPDHS